MKKLIIGILMTALSVAVAVGFAGCGQNKAGTAGAAYYGHNAVAYATVTTDKAGKITKVDFEEVETLNVWTVTGAWGAAADNVAAADLDGTSAKKIQIGDVVLTRSDDGKTYAGSGKTLPTARGTDPAWTDPAIAFWYYEQATQGNYWILKADGSKYDIPFTNELKVGANAGKAVAKKDRLRKSQEDYRTSLAEGQLSWEENMTKISAWIVSKGTTDGYDSLVQKDGNGNGHYWFEGDVTTGATFNDLPNYMRAAALAYAKIGQK
ncbi:hypothetical protein FACS1894211_07530 [Clostridia bacterium]|nr:hypothetical protein FACS1894211_07530 [Clostridia bacterium]